MKRPYRDVLVWLTDIQRPDNSLATERAIARVFALLKTYDRDQHISQSKKARSAYAPSTQVGPPTPAPHNLVADAHAAIVMP